MTELKKTDIEESPWNPFLPTKRDRERTEQLASKNPVLAGILSFIFVPLGLVYLNRGINALKISGYIFATGFLIGVASGTKEDSKDTANVIGFFGNVAMTTEQIMTVNKARQRQQEKAG